MGELASRIVVLAVIAFGLWVVLLWTLRRAERSVAGVVAAVLSWAGASWSAGWVIAALRRSGLWPLL